MTRFRLDTGEVVETDPVTDADRQMELSEAENRVAGKES